jgi:hypothetical protein
VQYDWVMYLLDDSPENRRLIDRYIEVWEYRKLRNAPCQESDRSRL